MWTRSNTKTKKKTKKRNREQGRIFRCRAGLSGGAGFSRGKAGLSGARKLDGIFDQKTQTPTTQIADRIKEGYNQQLKLEKDVIQAMANPNPNFLWLFRGQDETKTNLWMDLWMLTEETLESDTKMIWGGPIFSVSGGAMMNTVMNTMNL